YEHHHRVEGEGVSTGGGLPHVAQSHEAGVGRAGASTTPRVPRLELFDRATPAQTAADLAGDCAASSDASGSGRLLPRWVKILGVGRKARAPGGLLHYPAWPPGSFGGARSSGLA